MERMGFEKDRRIRKQYNNNREFVTIGGKSFWTDSGGERRLAGYLEMLKVGGYIKDWAREQTTFKTIDGVPFWKVDYDVLNNDGSFEYWEFKGKMEGSVITKLSLLFAERPEVQVVMVFDTRKDAMKLMRSKVSYRIKRICLQKRTGYGVQDLDRNEIVRKRRKQ